MQGVSGFVVDWGSRRVGTGLVGLTKGVETEVVPKSPPVQPDNMPMSANEMAWYKDECRMVMRCSYENFYNKTTKIIHYIE
ncbi:hypothetical protein A9Z63_03105 [Moraxella lacunata]|uniref:Uncharacterized protein n=1 Tax=Moraxella lacunata TaxID=477 RepID=A0A1B8PZI2_MORLA|nr:hypothetical protein A9309_07615 [Moraxella lacunata]OBX64648.1 hypothetical protein A9Z63_03105 [Moraxella lacunata]OPH38853.1 hypothetical protein B5J94_02135 [Moraxella lacunata]